MKYNYEWKNGKKFSYNEFWSSVDPIIVIDKRTGEELQFGFRTIKNGKYVMEYNSLLDCQEFWNFACATAPDTCIFVPEFFQTPELMKVMAKNTSYHSNLSSMALEKLERKAGMDAVVEVCNIMIDRFCDAIGYVPDEYLTDEVINHALVKYCGALSRLPAVKRTDERCVLSVSTWGSSLAAVPEDKKDLIVITKDGEKKLYEFAVSVSGMALGSVPEDKITSDLCIEALKTDGDALKYVPKKFITPEFITKINQAGIVIPPRYRSTIINMGSDSENAITADEFNFVCNINDYDQYENIKLSDMPYVFTKRLRNRLERSGITTLGELFEQYQDFEFGCLFPEFAGTMNVLKCKFKGEDPKIDLDSTDANYMVSKIGLSLPFTKEIERKGLSIRDLMEQLTLPPEQQVWNSHLRGVGESSIDLSLEKLAIISQYYNCLDSEKSTKGSISGELALLNSQLRELQQQSALLDAKIDETICKIASLATQKVTSREGSYVKK